MAKEQNQKPDSQEEDYNGILGDYHEPEEAETPAPEESDAPKKNNTLKIVGISVASAAILGCLGFLGVRLWNNPDRQASVSEPDTSSQSQQETQTNQNTITDSNIAMASDHFTVTPAVMECFYRDYLSQYETMITAYYGVDASASLKDQMLPEEAGENMSWFDYFMTQAQAMATQILVFNEAANTEDYVMSASEQKAVDEGVESTDLSGYSENVTEDDLRTMLELEFRASSYFNHIRDNIEITDEACETYYQENKADFDTCGIMGFTISYDAPDDETDETAIENESQDEEISMTQEQAKQFADNLEKASSADDFKNQVCDILRTYEGYTEEELENIDASISSDSFQYSEGNQLAEWAYSGEVKVGDTTVMEGENSYSVYYLTREPGRDDTNTVNVRHILFGIDNHTEELADDADADASAAADEAALSECWQLAEDTLSEWEAGDKTEDSFAALATEKTEDPGSADTGGLYENVYPGQMVPAFNDWCFDTSRKPGDTGLVETNYGVHVMYFSGVADPMWKSNAKSALQSANMNDWYTEQSTVWTVSVNEEAISNIPG